MHARANACACVCVCVCAWCWATINSLAFRHHISFLKPSGQKADAVLPGHGLGVEHIVLVLRSAGMYIQNMFSLSAFTMH